MGSLLDCDDVRVDSVEEELESENDVASEEDVKDASTCSKTARVKGDSAVLLKKYNTATEWYTRALKLVKDHEEEAMLLCSRSAALASWCRELRGLPASESERRARYGQDPMALASLALKDASRAVELRPQCSQAHSRRGTAHFLLEQYQEAEEDFLEALGWAPLDTEVQNALKEVRSVLEGTKALRRQSSGPDIKRARVVDQSLDDYECILCMKLMYEPVTTPCGHSFCKGCFARAIDHGNKCPMCRTVLHVGRELPVTIALKNILSKSFPEEYQQRHEEDVAEKAAAEGPGAGQEPASNVVLPLFVMSTLVPGEHMQLNIFEPRYRLMIRRCMEGSRRFGMAQLLAVVGQGGGQRDSHEMDPMVCEVEIIECCPQPDGRYYIEVVGRRRIEIEDQWEQDGYRIGRGVEVRDEPINHETEEERTEADGSPHITIAELVVEVTQACNAWLDVIRSISSFGRSIRMAELMEQIGHPPPATDPEGVSFWAARVLVSTLSDRDILRVRLMRTTSTRERLQLELDVLKERLGGH